MDQSKFVYFRKKYTNYLHPTTQSDPDSQTAPHQARNTLRSCSAAPFHGRHSGFACGRASMRYPLFEFLLSDDPSRCSCRTTANYHLYQLSLLEYRFGHSGSSGFVGAFRLRHWCDCVLVPRVRRNPGRCRDRYTCRRAGRPVGNAEVGRGDFVEDV